MRLPAMNGYLTYLVAWILGKPLICYFSGDQRVQIFNGEKYRGLWAAPARMVALLHDTLFQGIVRASNASLFEGEVTLNRLAYDERKSFFMFPSIIEESQIWTRPRPFLDPARNLLFVGSLNTAKGIRFLLEALAHVSRSGLQCTLNICGDGPDRNSLELLTERFGLTDSVNFLGHVRWGTELTQLYRKAEILVHPSLSEGVPKVILEAMANGVAVIATTVGGIPGVVTQGENGILVPPKSSKAIADALMKVSQEAELRNRLVQGGYAFIREHTAEKQAWKMATIILESVGKTQIEHSRSRALAKD